MQSFDLIVIGSGSGLEVSSEGADRGSEAPILIQEVANAMRMRLTADAIAQSIYVHPALPEVVQWAFRSLSF